ncbi:hypothetical protein BDV95DRAFT_492060 [Massariosphaeria phaeospora]|uniref:FAD-binding domain-containing protein n=1 Tax=Massariosphaeria phaeospora TaxID=100035 RepID=A0A7C8MLR9_9PLEO|nr:hypothetical protein BDV95DRAFT_492060 [Massariosphaeria phaeospora]
MTSSPRSKKIALIGAGPASLSLAAILHRNHIPTTIYEAASTLRHQGGSLDLHPQSGQLALREAGLWEEFVRHARPECDCLKLMDLVDGKVCLDENENENEHGDVEAGIREQVRSAQGVEASLKGRPEIDREILVRVLFGGVGKGSVKFGMKVESVKIGEKEEDGEEKYDIQFSDGTEEKGFDLVVGGDGAWSKVRRFLTHVGPVYSGISCVELWHSPTAAANSQKNSDDAWFDAYVGKGSCFAFGDGCALLAQRQGDGATRTYACLRTPESFLSTCGIDWTSPTALTSLTTRYFSHIAPPLLRLLSLSTARLVPRTLYELPLDFAWTARPGVTLIGDAAHLMTPFAGEGVNVGMGDAVVLAREIGMWVKGEKVVGEAVGAYEGEMRGRARMAMKRTGRGKVGHFSEGGAEKMARRVREAKLGK